MANIAKTVGKARRIRRESTLADILEIARRRGMASRLLPPSQKSLELAGVRIFSRMACVTPIGPDEIERIDFRFWTGAAR